MLDEAVNTVRGHQYCMRPSILYEALKDEAALAGRGRQCLARSSLMRPAKLEEAIQDYFNSTCFPNFLKKPLLILSLFFCDHNKTMLEFRSKVVINAKKDLNVGENHCVRLRSLE